MFVLRRGCNGRELDGLGRSLYPQALALPPDAFPAESENPGNLFFLAGDVKDAPLYLRFVAAELLDFLSPPAFALLNNQITSFADSARRLTFRRQQDEPSE